MTTQTLTLEQLMTFWGRGQLSIDDTLRGLLTHLMAHHETITQQQLTLERQQTALNALNLTVYSLRSDLDDLIAQTGIRPRFTH